ncbi:MAG: ABC transporter substrate-binding protein [Acidobacteriota bacterium]|nr:ABC transporter substrate-binding protein [Acidobacteriota bacterium]MDE3044503.1 ABC transporter substrate-binding protein [Acidobacteriota bacterium]MDE3108160.1 ABC transporter substrate-binding protein [Acidobacteriota bacterium]MDE3222497.1 ABC transporter substrate-binding protein [Acidobacteriota bacterium]
MTRRGAALTMAFATMVSVVGIGVSSGQALASPKLKPIVVGGMFPFTGSKSLLSNWGTHGVAVGIYEVNQAGGVLGHKLKTAYVDDAADSVDALPAFRKLMLSHPTFVVGPFSPTIEAVINQFQPNNVADFMVGGLTTLDNMQKPYVFRTSSSDSNEAIAMAYYAISKGWKTASLIFDNSDNSQGFVAPLEAAFKALGGTVQQDITLTPGQSSYSTELTQAFAGNPSVIFDSMDANTAATLFSDGQQLGYMNVPWIGDDLQSAPQGSYAKSFGPTASTELTAALPASPSTADNAYNHFLADYQQVWRTTSIIPTTFNEYDSVVIASLAMTYAKSTNPKVWVKDVTKISNPPGKVCGTYATCVALIKKGVKINYDGAAGNDDFNKYHNVFSGFQMLGFDSSLNNVLRAVVTPANLATVVAKEAK